MFKLLLDFKAEHAVKDMFNRSALHFAIEGGDGSTMNDFQKIEKCMLNLDTRQELLNDVD